MLPRMKSVLLVCLCAAAATVGCSNSGGPACSGGRACGGDLRGRWNVDASRSCIEALSADQDRALLSFCPDTLFDVSSVKLGGDVEFQNDGSFSQNLKFTGTVELVFASTCLVQQGTKLSCSKLSTATEVMAGFDCSQESSSNATGDCVCKSKPGSLARTGTFATKNGTLTQTPESGAAVKSDYCVAGDALYLSPGDASASKIASGDISLRANLVLTRGK